VVRQHLGLSLEPKGASLHAQINYAGQSEAASHIAGNFWGGLFDDFDSTGACALYSSGAAFVDVAGLIGHTRKTRTLWKRGWRHRKRNRDGISARTDDHDNR
jgi:hypothetical protein